MNCYFCHGPLSRARNCQTCNNRLRHPHVRYVVTTDTEVALGFIFKGSDMRWDLSLETGTSRLISYVPFFTIAFSALPSITIDNVLEKTQLYITFS